jgi:DNA helicase-2/ATP-dependent DNA helicase PcrA
MRILDEQAVMAQLSPSQSPAVLGIEGPCLILAGAGSGKTRTLTFKIAHLISNYGIDPARVLAVTFTNKAAAEMRERLKKILEAPVQLPWMGTFHSLCVRFLRSVLPSESQPEGLGFGWSKSFSIYDEDDVKKLMGALIKEAEAQALRNHQATPALPEVKELRFWISRHKGALISPEEALKDAEWERDRLKAELYAQYQSALNSCNALDFDDLLGLAVRVMEANPSLAADWSSWFQFRFVDEYQDTNPVQYRLLRLWSGWHPKQTNSDWRRANITAVGDDDQGIYSWRGADLKILRDFARDFQVDPEQIHKLEQNYRSTQNIVNAAASVIAHNPKDAHLRKHVFSEGDLGSKVRILRMGTDRDEADLVARECKTRGRATWAQTAVLYRTNAQSRVLEEALRRAQVAYRIVAGFSFYERKEVKDVLAYLKVLMNPKDDVALGRVLNYPPRNIGKTKEQALSHWSHVHDSGLWVAILEAETILGSTSAPVREFRTKVLQWRERSEAQSLVATVEMILEESGLLHYLESKRDEVEALANVKELLSSVVEALENDPSLDLAAFLQQVSLQTSADDVDESESVLLMTLHGSKGLEFDNVYLVGCEEGFLPMARTGEEPNTEEERRLMYVGMTRARKELNLLHCGVRRIFGQDDFNRRPSFFLEEIQGDYTEIIDRSGRSYESSSPWGGYRSQAPQPGSFAQVRKQQEEAAPRSTMRRTAPEDSEELILVPGSWVEHARFGRGQVRNVSGSGPDARIRVLFADGERTLVWKYANLRPATLDLW